MNLLTAALLQVWQLPQNLVGLVFGWFLKGKERFTYIQDVPRNIRFISGDNMFGGISLGHFVYFRKPAYDKLLRHEAGHCRQSQILGPLYLIVVGLPSLLWALWWHPGRSVPYSWFYTERWADRLGGVVRKP